VRAEWEYERDRSMTATRLRAEAEANDALTTALVRAAAQGVRPRCGDYETSHLWLSDHDSERKQAALMCRGCVVWIECDEVGQHQRFGTWAGIDRSMQPGRKKVATNGQP
jgi:hypothetical protein